MWSTKGWSNHSKIDKTKILMTNGSLMKVRRIAECSSCSILQYFWPALSDNWSWKTIFGLFQSGCFRQVLLYSFTTTKNKIYWFAVYNLFSSDQILCAFLTNSLQQTAFLSYVSDRKNKQIRLNISCKLSAGTTGRWFTWNVKPFFMKS